MIFGEKTLETLKEIDGTSLLTMDFNDDYKFDEFLKVGAKSDLELNSFLVEKLLNVDLPDEKLEAIVDGIKAKLQIDDIADVLGKLGGLFGKKN